jgi:serine phosphatase RsbU (regulator of sigma subunit)
VAQQRHDRPAVAAALSTPAGAAVTQPRFGPLVRRLRAARAMAARHRDALNEERAVAASLRAAARPVPSGPERISGVQLTAYHSAADRHAGVGGDWCDWQMLCDNRLLLDVGDVVGHGPAAAECMVRLRHTVAALASAGLEPDHVLAAANAQLLRAGRTEMATALVAVYDPGSAELRWASAGHPPPVFTDTVGRAWSGAAPAGMMLGVTSDARYECAAASLPGEQAVVLYTDGLVETRTATIDHGIGRLVAALRAPNGPDGPSRLAGAIDALGQHNPHDDVCILAAHVVSALNR